MHLWPSPQVLRPLREPLVKNMSMQGTNAIISCQLCRQEHYRLARRDLNCDRCGDRIEAGEPIHAGTIFETAGPSGLICEDCFAPAA